MENWKEKSVSIEITMEMAKSVETSEARLPAINNQIDDYDEVNVAIGYYTAGTLLWLSLFIRTGEELFVEL